MTPEKKAAKRRNFKNAFNYHAGNDMYEMPPAPIEQSTWFSDTVFKIRKTIYFLFIPLFRLPKIAYDYRHEKLIYLNRNNTWSFLI